jgi:hypothetical protein
MIKLWQQKRELGASALFYQFNVITNTDEMSSVVEWQTRGLQEIKTNHIASQMDAATEEDYDNP